jgi:hypothetical protein
VALALSKVHKFDFLESYSVLYNWKEGVIEVVYGQVHVICLLFAEVTCLFTEVYSKCSLLMMPLFLSCQGNSSLNFHLEWPLHNIQSSTEFGQESEHT